MTKGKFTKIGREIRKVRGERTQAAFANLIGTSQGRLSLYEAGIEEPSKDVIKKLVLLSGLPAETFMQIK